MAGKPFIEAQSLATQTLELGIALAVQLGMEELPLEIPLSGGASLVLSSKKVAFSSVRCSSISNFHQGEANKSNAKKRPSPWMGVHHWDENFSIAIERCSSRLVFEKVDIGCSP